MMKTSLFVLVFVAVALNLNFVEAAPPTWTCTVSYYNATDGCDCNCGAYDPDCSKPNQYLYNCIPEATGCSLSGHCVVPAPANWTCASSSYASYDGFCDCGCGTQDPDCGTGATPPYLLSGCPSPVTQQCLNGVCAPKTWTCSPGYFNASDGCDCGCGIVDPDCSIPGAPLYGCPTGTPYRCSVHANCIPASWTCADDFYGQDNYCDCGCGAQDPDCSRTTNPILYGCVAGANACVSGVCTTIASSTTGSAAVTSGLITTGFSAIPGWACNVNYYNATDGCDCNCGIYDPDCDKANQTLYGCSGRCSNYNGAAHCVPSAWTCPDDWYGTNDGYCDCGSCGPLTDPDCNNPAANPNGGCPGGSCVNGACVTSATTAGPGLTTGSSGIPGWTCSASYYNATDGCDCECGVWDPDCDKPNQVLYGCSGTCYNLFGVAHCVAAGWNCTTSYYNNNDGCDCNCGAQDPDCDIAGSYVYNCLTGATCVNGLCVYNGTSSGSTTGNTVVVPPGWTCSSSYYSANDGCDCNCGVQDPDCGVPGNNLLNCPSSLTYVCIAGACVSISATGGSGATTAGTGIPGWTCSVAFYNNNDGCDCGCGIRDPDCDKANQTLYNCPTGWNATCYGAVCVPANWTCPKENFGTGDGCDCNCGFQDTDCTATSTLYGCPLGGNYQCTSGHCVPAGWTCPASFYNTLNGCNCGCGAPDADCAVSGQQVLGCPPNGNYTCRNGVCSSGASAGSTIAPMSMVIVMAAAFLAFFH